jgi:hypothetical protein
MTSTTMAGRFITVAEILEELDIPVSTWNTWRAKGATPEARTLPNGKLRIARADYERWLDALPRS